MHLQPRAFLSLGFVLSLVFATAGARAQPRLSIARPARGLVDCTSALIALQGELGEPEADDYYSITKTRARTVSRVGARTGRWGGRILTLRQRGLRWDSDFSTTNFDPQGDPRWFVAMIGADAAEAFGFRILARNRAEVPDRAEFQGALAAVDAELRKAGDRVPVSFYGPSAGTRFTVERYLRTFRDAGGLPMEEKGNPFLHDLSFHTAAVFLPPAAVDLKRREAAYLEAFLAYAGKRLAGDARRAKAFRFYAFALRTELTLTIDNGTGMLAPILVSHALSPHIPDWDAFVGTALDYMVSKGEAPFDHLGRLLGLLDVDTKESRDVFTALIDPETLAEHRLVLPLVKVREVLDAFDRRFDRDRTWPLAWAPYRDRIEMDRLCAQVTERRARIRAAALGLR